MTSKRSYGRVALAALMLFAMTSVANARSYAVEVVVFSNPGGYAQSAEAWRPEPGMPDTSRARPVSAGGGVAPVSPSAYRLSGAWQALRDSAGYRPLRHVAWTQRGTSRSNAPVVLVGEDPDSPVYGTVTVSRGRFLHVDVDLIYRDGDNRYRFRSHRRMRSNEIHYMDHPMFGLLVVITPLSG